MRHLNHARKDRPSQLEETEQLWKEPRPAQVSTFVLDQSTIRHSRPGMSLGTHTVSDGKVRNKIPETCGTPETPKQQRMLRPIVSLGTEEL